MNGTKTEESNQYLLTLAREYGYRVSLTQLARWHRVGLLPRPRQQSIGWARGTQSLYPVGTGEQLLLLCRLHAHEHRFANLAWKIWWEGYPVASPLIRKTLQQATTRLSLHMQWCLSFGQYKQGDLKGPGVSEEVLDRIEQFVYARSLYKPLRRIRKRLGREHFVTFIRLLVDIASGAFDEYSALYDALEIITELRILAKGLGLDEPFLRDDANITHYIGKVFVPTLQDALPWLRTLPWEQSLAIATHFDLQQARDEIRLRQVQQTDITPAQRALSREYPFWVHTLYKKFPVVGMEDQAILLVVWLALRSVRSL